MSAPPFANEYALRMVAENDSKACNTCYKPTNTVLLSSNQKDFFYVCEQHLKDETFATAVQPEEYKELIKEKAKLTGDLAQWKYDMDKIKPYAWTKLVSNLSLSKEKDGKENEEYKELSIKIMANNERLNQLNEQIKNYKFKQYKLDKDIYKIRINNFIQMQMNKKRQQKIHSTNYFPSVPQNKIV